MAQCLLGDGVEAGVPEDTLPSLKTTRVLPELSGKCLLDEAQNLLGVFNIGKAFFHARLSWV